VLVCEKTLLVLPSSKVIRVHVNGTIRELSYKIVERKIKGIQWENHSL